MSLLPNTVTTVKGEALLFDKMTPFLSTTEKWMEDNFTSEEVLSAIADLEASHTTRMLAYQIAAYDAFHRAIPHLDVILTPNGFGIVSNSNIAPSSRERVERLMASLLEHRDRLLMQASMHFEHDALFDIVNTIRDNPEEFPEWHSSATAELYAPTVFENKKESLGYWF